MSVDFLGALDVDAAFVATCESATSSEVVVSRGESEMGGPAEDSGADVVETTRARVETSWGAGASTGAAGVLV